MAIRGTTALCSGGLGSLVANADLKEARILHRIDEWVDEHDMAALVGPAVKPGPTILTQVPTELELARFGTVIWATGFRPTYNWLDPRALDRRGRIDHDGGVATMQGLYLLGLPFLRSRRSNLLVGLGLDAGELGQHLVEYLRVAGRMRPFISR
jgi:putative flavoprotein involved in K+ transport